MNRSSPGGKKRERSMQRQRDMKDIAGPQSCEYAEHWVKDTEFRDEAG